MAQGSRSPELAAQERGSAPLPSGDARPPRLARWALGGTAYSEDRNTLFPHAKLVLRFQSEDGELSPEYALEADGDGRYTWSPDGAPPTGVAMLEARQERHLPSQVQLALDAAQANPVLDIIVFGLDLEIAGHVRDASGDPIAGAKLGNGQIGGISAADGSFHFWGKRNIGEYRILCRATGYASTEVVLETDQLESSKGLAFVLAPGLTVEGIVTRSNGTLLEGVEVSANDRLTARPLSQPNGRYLLDGLDPASRDIRIRASLEGYLTKSISLPEHSAGRVSLDIELYPAPRIRGIVRREDGDPVAGASVRFRFTRIGSGVSTDASGAFELQSPQAGPVVIKTTATGYAEDTRSLELDASQSSALNVEIVLAAGRDLSGFIVDAEGQAIERAAVFPYVGRTNIDGWVQTGADGRFLLESMPTEGLRLEVPAKGYLRGDFPSPSFDDPDQRFTLQPAGTLAGTALDARTGQALNNFRVRFIQPDLRPGETALGDMDLDWLQNGSTFSQTGGRWTYPKVNLIPGEVVGVEIRADGYSPALARRAVVAAAPNPDDLVLRLDPAVRLEGSVTLETSGAAVGGASVRAFRPQSGAAGGLFADYAPSNTTESATDGRFALDGVPTGELLLQVEHDSFGIHVAGPLTIPPGSALQTHHVVVPGGGRIEGLLLDAGGATLSGALVRLAPAQRYGADDTGDAETRTDSEGRFAFDSVIAGPYALTHHLDLAEDRPWPHFIQNVEVHAAKTTRASVRPSGSASLHARLDTTAALPTLVRVKLDRPAGSPAEQGPKVIGALAHAGLLEVAGMQPGTYVASGWFRDAKTGENHEFSVPFQLHSGVNEFELDLD